MDKRVVGPQSRRQGEKDRRKRPGTPNLNRPVNPIRTNQSAYHVINKRSSYNHPPCERVLPTVDFITASEDDSDDTDLEENAEQQQQNGAISDTSDSDGDMEKEQERASPSRIPRQSSGITSASKIQSVTSSTKARDSRLCLSNSSKNINTNNKDSNPCQTQSKSQNQNQTARIKITEHETPTKNQNQKVTQGTNTNTTADGIQPLEGIHGAFGFGCDIFTKSNKVLGVLDSDSDSDVDIGDGDHEAEEDEMEEEKHRIDRIKVCRSIFFDKSSGRRQAYGAVVQIHNLCDYHMSYCVRSSSPEKFRIQPQIGMIGPRGITDVMVQTNPKFDFYFSDIANEVFKVLATPVYTRAQMEQSKLEILWRAYGTKFFPRVVAETHLINAVYPIESAAGETSGTILSDILRSIRAYRGNNKEVPLQDNPVSEDVFLNAWPLEDDHFSFLSCRRQICGWLSMYKKAKKETRRMKLEFRSCVASIVVAGSVFLILMSMLESPEERRISSERFMKGLINFMSRFLLHPLAPISPPVENSEPPGIWELAQSWALKLVPIHEYDNIQ